MSARRLIAVPVLAFIFLATASVPGDDKIDETRAGWATCSYQFAQGTDGDYGVCTGVVLREHERFVACFGVDKRPKDKGRYLYLILFRCAPSEVYSLGAGGSSSTSNDEMDCNSVLTLSEKQIEIAYKYKADPKTHVFVSETIKIGGKEVKKDDPHVFLVDLTADKVAYVPVKVDLPDAVPELKEYEGKKDWAAKLHLAIDQLKEKSPEVKKFLDAKAEK